MSAPGRELFASLYGELRAIAQRQLRASPAAAISATTVLHEAYIGMAGNPAPFRDRQHFICYTAHVMRNVIVDCVRERRALKRGGKFHITSLRTEAHEAVADERELSRLSDAIDQLATQDSRLAAVVDLKYFCGYSFEEIAALRELSVKTVQRDWEKARVLLFSELQNDL